jgi:uncharacterized protein (UPF0332 family)
MATRPFDWPDFLTLAEELAVRPEEHCLRTAIGRAYYYAYHLAKARVIENEFVINKFQDSHKQVWEKFGDSPDFRCKKLYELAQILKGKRQQADYDANFPRIAAEFPTIIDMTKKFARDLDALDKSVPVNRGVRAQ